MKENTKTKFAILALIILCFIGGFANGRTLSKDAKLEQIGAQLTQLSEINQQLLTVEQQRLEVQKEQNRILEEESTHKLVYDFSDEEIVLLSQLLCGESGKDGDGEYDFETQIAKGDINWPEVNKVLEVVMNRTLTPGIYADNVTDVVLQPGAFSVFPKNLDTKPSPEVIEAVRYWCDAFNSPEYVPSIPDDHYWFSGSRGGNVTRDHL
jgi:hypothetical protein